MSDKQQEAISELDPTIPCYITGHSLGGAMAVLAAYDLALNFPQLSSQIRMSCYASPNFTTPPESKSLANIKVEGIPAFTIKSKFQSDSTNSGGKP